MGNFYTSLVVRGAGPDEVVETMRDRHAFVAFVGQDVFIFDKECESQDPGTLAALGAQVSRALSCSVLSVLNHDDDVLLLQLHSDGEPVFDYDSSPGYFNGEEHPPSLVNAKALSEAFGASESAIHAVLASDDDEYLFAGDRHERLYEVLGLPPQVVGYGFSYISEGDTPLSLDRTHLVEVGGFS